MTEEARRRWVRGLFAAYAALLFLATHWPQPDLGIPPVGNLDKVAHFGAFAVWAALLTASGFFGPALSRRNVLISMLAGLAYAGVDEGLQAVSWLNRSAEWADYGANAAGVAAAALGAAAASKSRGDKA